MNKSPNKSRTKKLAKPIVFCDFDGTVTQADVTDHILEELADPTWRDLEAQWVQGLIGSKECLERQMALVTTSTEELNKLIDAVPLDPDFKSFYKFTEEKGLPFFILSDGFDYVIRRILRRAGANGELKNGRHLFTSSLRVDGKRLSVSFPHSTSECTHSCATCKAALIKRLGSGYGPIIFIGDGLSDRFAVEHSDVIFAKAQLLKYCRNKEIACHEFETFSEIQESVTGLLDGLETRGMSKARARSIRAVPAT